MTDLALRGAFACDRPASSPRPEPGTKPVMPRPSRPEYPTCSSSRRLIPTKLRGRAGESEAMGR